MAQFQLDWSYDLGMEFLEHTCQVIDETLARQYAFIDQNYDMADQLDVPEMVEYLIGLGFAACQGYITGVCAEMAVSKPDALEVGPRHAGGATIAALTNYAANWWKHCDEWPEELTGQSRRTYDGLMVLGVSASYPLTDALVHMTGARRPHFRQLAAQLSIWRDAVLDEVSSYERPGA